MNSIVFQEEEFFYTKKGNGSPLVFIHNGGNDHRIWDYQIDEFSKNYEIFALDLPGFGESAKPDINYTLHYYTEFLEYFLDTLGLREFILIGNCIGSSISINYALSHKEKLKALILFNIASSQTLKFGGLGFLESLYSKVSIFRTMLKKFSPSLVVPKLFTKPFIDMQYVRLEKKDEGFLKHLASLYSHKSQMRIMHSLLEFFTDFSKFDNFNKPEDFPPSCVFWGKSNKVLSPLEGEKLCESFQPEQQHFISGAGHLLMREKPEQVNKIMRDFIKAL